MTAKNTRHISRHEKCQNGEDCKGPGCRVNSGKTAANVGRAHPNRTNVGSGGSESQRGGTSAKKKVTK